ncbi:MAG: hypothetical protein K6G12_00685 [Lachnospiraceae bacterium]|nr:hypothetical protein [Lachnospiraceae bacterium]
MINGRITKKELCAPYRTVTVGQVLHVAEATKKYVVGMESLSDAINCSGASDDDDVAILDLGGSDLNNYLKKVIKATAFIYEMKEHYHNNTVRLVPGILIDDFLERVCVEFQLHKKTSWKELMPKLERVVISSPPVESIFPTYRESTRQDIVEKVLADIDNDEYER